MKHPPILIIGFGRMGGALARRLKAAGWPVTVQPRSKAAFARAKKARIKVAGEDDFDAARVCILAVPDDAVAEVARAAGRELSEHASLVHCSGALTLDAFMLPKVSRGSFHPLVAVSDPADPLAGASVAVAASDAGLGILLMRLAKALEMRPIAVPEARRAAYHAGAVVSAGLVVSLLDAAAEATGLSRAEIEPALLHLTRSALRGAGERGLAGSLTGPVARGDAGVVAAHLVALPEDLGQVYRTLSRRMLVLLEDQLDADARARLAAVLDRPLT